MPIILVFLAHIVLSIIWSCLAQSWYYRTFPANKTVVIWDMRQGISKMIDDYDLTRKYKVVASVSAEECMEDLSILNDADTVYCKVLPHAGYKGFPNSTNRGFDYCRIQKMSYVSFAAS